MSEKEECACTRVYGMNRCVASYDAEKDMMHYRGIPCDYCKEPIDKWEDEITMCEECFNVETHLLELNHWYAETIYEPNLGVMHQHADPQQNDQDLLDELLGEVL